MTDTVKPFLSPEDVRLGTVYVLDLAYEIGQANRDGHSEDSTAAIISDKLGAPDCPLPAWLYLHLAADYIVRAHDGLWSKAMAELHRREPFIGREALRDVLTQNDATGADTAFADVLMWHGCIERQRDCIEQALRQYGAVHMVWVAARSIYRIVESWGADRALDMLDSVINDLASSVVGGLSEE